MPPVRFYLLEAGSTTKEQIALLLADLWQRQPSIYLYCRDEAHAQEWDQWLWEFPYDRLIPHHIGMSGKAPIELGWHRPHVRYQLLVNLNDINQAPPFAAQFPQVVDFVPWQENEKIVARQRYRHYQQMGCLLTTTPFAER